MIILIIRTEEGFQEQVDNFLNKAPNYPALGLSATMLTELRKDWTLAQWLIQTSNSISTYNQGIVAYKKNLRNGTKNGALPTIPVLPATPAISDGGMEKRFRYIVQTAMRSPAMTPAIAKDLGVLAPASNENIAANEAKPTYKIKYSSGGHPLIIWKKGPYEGVEIQKSRDGVNFTKLDRDYKPDFVDKSDLPAPTTAEVWYYRLIYLINETEHLGQWSDVKSINVGG